MRKLIPALIVLFLVAGGCTPVERTAYNLFTGTKAGLVKYRAKHPECSFDATTGLSASVTVEACTLNNRITSGKDALITAAEVYCSGPNFEAGGTCDAPKKGDPAAPQAAAKLSAAVSSLQQIIRDAKGAF